VISRKYGTAVERNQTKRRIREAFRKNAARLPGADILVRPRPACREASVELVVMGGFLKHVRIPPDFEHRVVNIHPALIPAFCGKGFYGLRVHSAVLEYGAKVSGCTVHFADNQYDHGPIILQLTVEVRDDATPETLAHRVFAQECEAYPEAIRLFASGHLRILGRRVFCE